MKPSLLFFVAFGLMIFLATFCSSQDLNLQNQNIVFDQTFKLVGLGESSHGSSENKLIRQQICLQLIRNQGVNLVLIEMPYYEGCIANEAVVFNTISIDSVMNEVTYWTNRTIEFRSFLMRIKELNDNLPMNQKVFLIGIDIQSDHRLIDEYLFSNSSSTCENVGIQKLAYQYALELSSKLKATVVDSQFVQRDLLMFQLIDSILKLESGKVCFIGHNGHTGAFEYEYKNSITFNSVGKLLKDKYQAKYLTFGVDIIQGDILALKLKFGLFGYLLGFRRAELKSVKLPTPSQDSFLGAQLKKNKSILVLSQTDLSLLKKEYENDFYFHEISALYSKRMRYIQLSPKMFDYLVLLQSSSPITIIE